ncbi:MAG: hypothetical protein AAGA17_00890 [Actinomycetota bacterium]
MVAHEMLPAGWGRRRSAVAVALVHWPDGEVDVHLADDDRVLTRVVALEVVAATSPSRLGTAADGVRAALRQGEYAEAIVRWMEATGARVDGFPDERIWRESELDDDSIQLELGLARLFDDGG